MRNRSNPKLSLYGGVRRGISLVEVSFSTVLVGVLAVAALNTVGGVARTSRVTASQIGGNGLARQLMAEVLSQSYEDPDEPPEFGHEGGETQGPTARADFDDTDDYDDWSESPPQLKDGTVISEHTGWRRDVVVRKVDPTSMSILSDARTDRGLRCVTVTVTDPQGRVTTLVAHRANAGALEQAIGVKQTVVTWMGTELQIGSAKAAGYAGTMLLNHAQQP